MNYEFNTEDAERFAMASGCKTKKRNGQLEFNYCPYCKGGGKDKNTFSISLKTGQFECKRSSCGIKGNMITLARDFADVFKLNDSYGNYFNIQSTGDYGKNRYRKFKKQDPIVSKPGAVEYLNKRGLTTSIINKYEITTKEGNDNIVVFPFRDIEDNIQFIKYRNTAYIKGETKGSKEWCESNCKPILFGMNHCTTRDRLVITEGQIDSLSCADAGINNAVSVPTGCNGFTWIPYCYDFCNSFSEIVVFGDHENGKVTLFDEINKHFKKVKCVRPADYKDCKDANELLQKYGAQALIDAVDNAEIKINGGLRKLESVEIIDAESKVPDMITGIPSVDYLIKGFFRGQLILLTGKCGDGKSTVASQLCCEALAQGHNVFAYSGELTAETFKAGIVRQAIGCKNYDRTEVNKFNEWVSNRFYLYDNEQVFDGDETAIVIEMAKNAIIAGGCSFLLIDNLMTAMSTDTDSKYDKQSEFTRQLAHIAKSFNVIILLIAHPRKNSIGSTNDDISGSADIANRADIVMSYSQPKKETAIEEREIYITKNRLLGRVTREGIPMFYDPKSKRVSDRNGDFSKYYLDIDKAPAEEIPFDDSESSFLEIIGE